MGATPKVNRNRPVDMKIGGRLEWFIVVVDNQVNTCDSEEQYVNV